MSTQQIQPEASLAFRSGSTKIAQWTPPKPLQQVQSTLHDVTVSSE